LELEEDAEEKDDQSRSDLAPVRQHPREPDPDEDQRPVIAQAAGPDVAEVLQNEQRAHEKEKDTSDQPRSPPPIAQRIHRTYQSFTENLREAFAVVPGNSANGGPDPVNG